MRAGDSYPRRAKQANSSVDWPMQTDDETVGLLTIEAEIGF